MINPINVTLSHALAEAYSLFPDVRYKFPPERLDGITTLTEFMDVLGEVNPDYPVRLFLEGHPKKW